MADYARKLISGNPALSQRITVSVVLSYFYQFMRLIIFSFSYQFHVHISADRLLRVKLKMLNYLRKQIF